jgi:hypothetical protein
LDKKASKRKDIDDEDDAIENSSNERKSIAENMIPTKIVNIEKKRKTKQDNKKHSKSKKKVKDAFGINKKVEFLENIME